LLSDLWWAKQGHDKSAVIKSVVTVSPVTTDTPNDDKPTGNTSHYTFVPNRPTISFTNIANTVSCTSVSVPEFLLRTPEGKKHHTQLCRHDRKIALH